MSGPQPDYSDAALEPTRKFVKSGTSLPTLSSPQSGDSQHARVAIVTGKQSSRSWQELETLRARLKAATIVILFGFAIYLVRSYFDDRPLQGFHTFVVVA